MYFAFLKISICILHDCTAVNPWFYAGTKHGDLVNQLPLNRMN